MKFALKKEYESHLKSNCRMVKTEPDTLQKLEQFQKKNETNTTFSQELNKKEELSDNLLNGLDSLNFSKKQFRVKVSYRNKNLNLSDFSIKEEKQMNEIVDEIKSQTTKKSSRCKLELMFINAYKTQKTSTIYGVADEWIENYENFLNGQTRDPPSRIDNLVFQEKLRKVQLPYYVYAVNETLWKFLQKLYNAGPELIIMRDKVVTTKLTIIETLSDSQNAMTTCSRSDAIDSLKSSSTNFGQNIQNFNGPIGMINNGYYCYMNSCLQSLLSLNKFVEYVIEGKYKKLIDPDKIGFWSAMSEVLEAAFGRNPYFRSESIKKLSMRNFDPNAQHDAHEFLNFILTGMQNEANLSQPKNMIEPKDSTSAWSSYKKYHISVIDELFAGQLMSKVTCFKCKNTTTKYDPFLDISLSIIDAENVTLDNCFNAFQSEGEFVDSYLCEKCKTTQKAIKKMHVDIFPDILIIHLKRFQTLPKREKVMISVDFPIDKWEIHVVEDPQQQPVGYSLKAMICHYGHMDSGHYVCYTKRGKEWFLCNDEKIFKVVTKDILTRCRNSVYLLIYEKGQ